MNKLYICSYFRDSQRWGNFPINQVNTFFNNILNQKDIDVNNIYFSLLEGNSKDNTKETLENYRNLIGKDKVNIITYEIAGSNVASIVSANRFKNLSILGNIVLNYAKNSESKLIFWCESDLIIPNNILSSLIKYTTESQWESTLAIAPIPTFNRNYQDLFYDTWAFEGNNGEKWGNGDLVHLTNYYQDLRPMRSIGSCALLNADLLRKYSIDFGEGCFPELCRLGRSFDLNIYCDTTLFVKHPSDYYIQGRLI